MIQTFPGKESKAASASFSTLQVSQKYCMIQKSWNNLSAFPSIQIMKQPDKSEFVEETMMDKKTQKIGVICSIVQIILSIICLIYSAINQENIIMWVLFLCSGILSLSSNISRNNKKEDE